MAVRPLSSSSFSSTQQPQSSSASGELLKKVTQTVEEHIQKLKNNISYSSIDLKAFSCPITLEIFKEPVIDDHGHTFEKQAIEKHLETSPQCPINREPIQTLTSNRVVQQFIEENQKKDPIPTFSLFKKSLPELAKKNLRLVDLFIKEKEYEEALSSYSKALQYTHDWKNYQKLPLFYEMIGQKQHALLSYLYLLRYQLEDLQFSCAQQTLLTCIEKYSTASESILDELLKTVEELDCTLDKNLIKGVYAVDSLAGHTDYISALVSNDEYLFSGSNDNTIKMWSTNTGLCEATLNAHEAAITSLALADKTLFSGDYGGTIKIWDLRTHPPTLACTFKAHRYQISSLATTKGKLISDYYGTIKIWDLSAHPPTLSATLEKKGGSINPLAIFNEKLFICNDKVIEIWDLSTQPPTCLRSLNGHGARVESLAFVGNNLFSICTDGGIKIWDLSTSPPACTRTLQGNVNGTASTLLSVDRVLIAACSCFWSLKIWDVNTEPPTCRTTLYERTRLLTFSKGKLYLDQDRRNIKVLDFMANHKVIFKEIADLFEIYNLQGNQEAAQRFAMMPVSAKKEINQELYKILKTFLIEHGKENANDALLEQLATNKQRAQAIRMYLEKLSKKETST